MSRQRDIVCFSHLRWNFVFQRPHHLLSRAAREHRVYFVERPIYDGVPPWLELTTIAQGVTVVVPHLREGVSSELAESWQRRLLQRMFAAEHLTDAVHWYYDPSALAITPGLPASAVVYDCMDDVAAADEEQLFRQADVVFTAGMSMYEAKRERHRNVHVFPSSVDVAHFARARGRCVDPADQAPIGHPRIGYAGVIDHRVDLALLQAIAEQRPAYELVLIGPVVGMELSALPRGPNVHWLGARRYEELPSYLSGWDVAILPYARNDATRLYTPTRTPEYLAAGRPVVSTPLLDVVAAWGDRDLVRIADTPDAFVTALDAALTEDPEPRRSRADALLARSSWDRTWSEMWSVVEGVEGARSAQSG